MELNHRLSKATRWKCDTDTNTKCRLLELNRHVNNAKGAKQPDAQHQHDHHVQDILDGSGHRDICIDEVKDDTHYHKDYKD